VRAHDRPADLGGRVVRSVDFEAVSSPDNAPAPLVLGNPDIDVTLRYETSGSQIVPSGFAPASLSSRPLLAPSIPAADAASMLSAYFVASNDNRKIFGSIDPRDQTIHVQSSFTGDYQIRTVLRDQSFSFDVSNVSNHVITPNGDGRNDTVVFTFDNPRASGVSGKIFDVKGRLISEMLPGPIVDSSLKWDGKAGGMVVPQGVYLYQIQAEGQKFTGTVVVIR
jgi:gliding motility-associated-like protein